MTDFTTKAFSKIGLGTAGWANLAMVSSDLEALVAAAAEWGVTHIDTAPAYGRSEEIVGKLLKSRPNFTISTKAGEEWTPDGSHYDFSRQSIRTSVERSLRRLNRDHLDVVFVHSDPGDVALKKMDAVEELQRLKRAGHIGSVGVSPRTADGARLIAQECDALMLSLNPVFTEHADILSEVRAGHVIFSKKSLLQGQFRLLAPCTRPVESLLRFSLLTCASDVTLIGCRSLSHVRDVCAIARDICTPI